MLLKNRDDDVRMQNPNLFSSLPDCRLDYRNEYHYLNLLFNKIVLGKHSLHTTVPFSQFWIGNSKADFLIINGKAVVYEIKTDLDNLRRLEGQLTDYYKAFPLVYVVCGEGYLPVLSSLLRDEPTGLMCLSRKDHFHLVKQAEEYWGSIDKDILFGLLRKPEYTQLVLDLGSGIPKCKEVDYYERCEEIVMEFPVSVIYKNVLKLLKKRDIMKRNEMIEKIPYQYRAWYYFSDFTKKERQLVQTQLGEV